MFFTKEDVKTITDYLNKPFLKKMLYFGRGLDLATLIGEYAVSNYSNEYKKHRELVKALWTKDTRHISDIFSGKEYGALKLIFDEENAKMFKEIWDRAPLYTYTSGYIRRSYRSNKSTSLYLGKNIQKLREFIYLAAKDFSLEKYLKDTKTNYEEISVIADIIAIELDRNNQRVLEGIKEIIYNDNNAAIVTREIIRGMLMSRNSEAHRIAGELLLAAKLQEGLRQAIVENIDEGSREGFIYLLKLINDNNLSRFSSVVRAFGTWTGLAIDVEKPKVINKCLQAAYDCLTNKDVQRDYINSSDNLLIYIGIWSIAFDEVEDIDNVIDGLLKAPEKYKKLAALQFIHETQFEVYRHIIGCKALFEEDFEVLAWGVKNLFNDVNIYGLKQDPKSQLEQYYGNDLSRCKNLFNQLKGIVDKMPKKEVKFEGSVFPWVEISISKSELIEKMLISIAASYDENVVDTLLDYRDNMNPDSRKLYLELFISKPQNAGQKSALIQFCGDRSSSVRESAFNIINKMNLSSEDYKMVEEFLQYKSGDLRKSAIKLLLKQDSRDLECCIEGLVQSGNENKRLAGIDMVSAIEGEVKYKNVYERCLGLISSNKDVTQKEKLLVKNISKVGNANCTFENGFGLYDKVKEAQIERIERPVGFNIKSVFSENTNELYSIMNKFSSLIHENREFEYESEGWDGTKTVTTLGGSNYLEPFKRGEHKLDDYPISDKIRELSEKEGLTCNKLIQLDFYFDLTYRLCNISNEKWFKDLFDDIFNLNNVKEFIRSMEKLPYFSHIKKYIELLINELSKEERFKTGKDVSAYLYSIIPPGKHYEEYIVKEETSYYYSERRNYIASSYVIEYWLILMRDNFNSEEEFTQYFKTAYNYYRSNKYNDYATLSLEHFGKALELGIIDENETYKELMARALSPDRIRDITNTHSRYNKDLLNYPRLMELGNRAVDAIVNIEVKRGELNTEVTHLAVRVDKCYGAGIFTSILLNMEKDTYIRGYNFVSDDSTKKQVLSHLLKCCYPRDGEGVEALKSCLEGKKVTSKQLIEGAMYSPQWLDIISEYLGYDGLKSACWYFHAHVNDFFSEEKAATVARYSPIAAQDFKDGAFDQEWFMDAYKTIGEKNFKLVYDSAKYIAGGGLHKRSQLFADATLGKLDIQEIKNRVMDKRNKDYLLTYGLLPIKDKEDLLGRYEYIHQYMKESKKFGAQRQASETRSANIALLNLARNAGYSDVNRLSWNMETAKLDSISQYLQAKMLEDVEIQLVIDELGQAEVSCTKDGKALKDIPSKLKKHEYIQEIKGVKKSLREQYSRARVSFESAMERADEFEANELEQLCSNPVLAPIIKNLIFISKDKMGYFNQCGLVDFNGEIHKLDLADKLLIAHSVHLYESGKWSEYQRDIFNRQVVQPFKQVFRELYLPNEDELREGTNSRRYAGHQVQPRRTLALLKTRGWMASNEEGLQKVYYKEDIIVSIYAYADWFSPSEIESPTLELVRFEDRKNSRPVPIDKVPRLIFSEVMRDLDLVVSVAHVGGVDPEASLSTVEIRRAIVRELLGLLKLENITLKENHAFITGVHGEYTVHLGSGVVHKMAAGAINILPVHSQHRGRIFLPFIDGDPKSAEIISKIILLAEDKKIKDPSILSQIR